MTTVRRQVFSFFKGNPIGFLSGPSVFILVVAVVASPKKQLLPLLHPLPQPFVVVVAAAAAAVVVVAVDKIL